MAESGTADASLFELLARQWCFDDEIVQTEFNSSDTAVLYRMSSGRLALVRTDDVESTKSRTRIEVDSGRTTIQRRKNPASKARFAPIRVSQNLKMVRMGENGFLALDHTGAPHLITGGAQSIKKFDTVDADITALSSNETGLLLAISRLSGITVYRTENTAVVAQINMAREIGQMAFSANGKYLAIFGDDCLDIIDIDNAEKPRIKIHEIGPITQLIWNKSGSHVACATSENSFHIVDARAQTHHTVTNYPGPVSTVAFSEKGNALLSSGAFRLTGWSSDDLPRNGYSGNPLKIGKVGFTIINTIAAHPSRSLVAVGYANGLVTVTSIGSSEEILIHHETGTEVQTLAWSNSGEHLSIGFKSGKAALVSFPNSFFK